MLWSVIHPEHEDLEVEAEDRLHAVTAAARAWNVPSWTGIARQCTVRLIDNGNRPRRVRQTRKEKA